jgi:predicted O-methyltransferase YrrM
MTFHTPELEQYLLSLTPPRSSVLAEMEAYARANKFPIIGPLVGQFLQQLVYLTNARRIFEMGSGYGYSAIWFASAMGSDGTVECTEMDEANIARGQHHAESAAVGHKIRWHRGDALESMARAEGEYDIILNDVDKEQYPRALEIAWPKLRRGGVMITDNVLWSGRVLTENPPSSATAGILEFNRISSALPDALCSLMPLRDGLMVALKR